MLCAHCEKEKRPAKFWEQDTHTLRSWCNTCRFQYRVRSPQHLAAKARKRKAKSEADAFWEEQARSHP